MTRETIERKCILTGSIKPISEMLRFVELDNTLLPDFNKKLPGKGMYITNSRFSLVSALEKKLFHRVSRHNLKISENFVDMVEQLLKQKALDSINIARKSGALVTGYEKVREAIKKNSVEFLIEANDAAKDGKEKMVLLAKTIEIFNLFSIDELDKTLNKVNTVHLAVTKNNVSESVYLNLKKYQNFIANGENNE